MFVNTCMDYKKVQLSFYDKVVNDKQFFICFCSCFQLSFNSGMQSISYIGHFVQHATRCKILMQREKILIDVY